MNAKIVVHAGTDLLKMLHTVNTNGIQTPEILCSPPGREKKTPSSKRQAASHKQT
jgi:hypothetical protein